MIYICGEFIAHLGKGNRKAEDLDIFRFLFFNKPQPTFFYISSEFYSLLYLYL